MHNGEAEPRFKDQMNRGSASLTNPAGQNRHWCRIWLTPTSTLSRITAIISFVPGLHTTCKGWTCLNWSWSSADVTNTMLHTDMEADCRICLAVSRPVSFFMLLSRKRRSKIIPCWLTSSRSSSPLPNWWISNKRSFSSSYKWMNASNNSRDNGLSSQMPIVSKTSPSKSQFRYN